MSTMVGRGVRLLGNSAPETQIDLVFSFPRDYQVSLRLVKFVVARPQLFVKPMGHGYLKGVFLQLGVNFCIC